MTDPSPAEPPPGPQTPPHPVVDSHHHVWDLSVRDRGWLHEDQPWADEDSLARLRRTFTMADLEPEAAAVGVGATVVVQTEAEPAETPELLALADGHPLVEGVVGWVNLMKPGAGEAIAALRELPGGEHLAGIRHPVLIEPDDTWLRRPEVLSGLTEVATAGLVYDVVCLQRQLPGALAAAEALPALTVVLDHVGNPEDEPPGHGPWATIMRSLAALPNTVCKLSGILSAPLAARPGGPADPAVLRGRARRVRAGPAHVRLGLAGMHAQLVLPGRVRGGASTHRGAQPSGAGGRLRRDRAPHLPARCWPARCGLARR